MNLEKLIEKFETGDIPTGRDFADLIRYCYNTNYKINKKDYAISILSNETMVNVPLTVDYERASFDVFINNSLVNDSMYEINYVTGTLTLNLNSSVPAVRNGFIRVSTIEEV